MEFPEQLSATFQKELLELVTKFLSPERKAKMEDRIRFRTRHICIVLEDIFQSHNASAVLRSCDCFGVQDVHIIENRNKYHVNQEVALGASKWLSLKKYNKQQFNTPEAYQNLRNKGFRIVATSPHVNDCYISELPLDKPIAIVFGTEKEGLSEFAIENADAWTKIPMVGFTESLNISVSAAITLHTLTQRLYKENIPWQLNEHDQTNVYLQWILNNLKGADFHISRFLESKL